MKSRDTKPGGSFTAWGTGFNYDYDANLRKLEVHHAVTGKAIAYMDFDRHLSRDPVTFVSILDKSCQIKALSLSNNTSIDLSATFEDGKLTPMLEETSRLAHYAFDLMHRNYSRFQRHFCGDTLLKTLEIRKIRRSAPISRFFTARAETGHGNVALAESTQLYAAMSILSQRIVQDLITREFVSHYEKEAHSLLSASSKISSLSLILNERFHPYTRLKNAPAPAGEGKNKFLH